MKRFLSAALASLMLLGGASSVFADAVPAASTTLTLKESSHLLLDTEKGYVDKIDGDITVAELKANFDSSITVKKDGGDAKADDAFVATDDIVAAADDSLKALIYGDVDRTGKINLTDVSATMKHIARWNPGISEDAADVDKTGTVNLQDASKILKVIAGWPDLSLGNVRLVFDNTKIKAENDDSRVELFFTNMMNKTYRENTANTGENAFKIKMARNEAESCQFLMTSTENMEGLTAELTPFVHEYGEAELTGVMNEAYYYDHSMMIQVAPDRNYGPDNWTGGNIPEVMLPMAESFELEAGCTQHFAITVTTDKDTPAGMYVATLNIRNAAGEIIKCANVYTYVWDFTLPDAPYTASLVYTASWEGDYLSYFNQMLDNNFSSYVLPVEITDPEADAYMSDPRITAFVIAGTAEHYGAIMSESDEATVANFKKVMSNPEWAKKGLFYYTDEPWGENLQKVKTSYEYLIDLLGTEEGVRNMTPLAGNNTFASEQDGYDGIDPVAYIDPYINVWCTSSSAFHLASEGGTWTPRRMLNKYGEFADRAQSFREKGEEIWWYVCTGPEAPYANYFTWYQGVINRVLSWQQYFNEVTGVLYYGTGIHWTEITKHKFNIYNGDGVLQFPGDKFGFDGVPLMSWRLFQLRDGMDDVDYMKIAEELVGRDAVIDVVKKVTTGMVYYTEDYRVMDAARDEIVELILEAQK